MTAPSSTLRCDSDLDRLVRRIAVEAAPVWSGDRPALTLCLHGCPRPGFPNQQHLNNQRNPT